MASPFYYTAEMVRAMPNDGNRYEVVYRELLVTPTPRPWHQVVLQRLNLGLGSYLAELPVGVLLAPPPTSPGAPTCWYSRTSSSPPRTRSAR